MYIYDIYHAKVQLHTTKNEKRNYAHQKPKTHERKRSRPLAMFP